MLRMSLAENFSAFLAELQISQISINFTVRVTRTVRDRKNVQVECTVEIQRNSAAECCGTVVSRYKPASLYA